MRTHLPLTYEYLRIFEEQLRQRAAFRKYYDESDRFYSMYNIGTYTMSPWKTVWRQQAARMTASVVGPKDGRPVVPNHKLTLVPAQSESEAAFLSAVLNSTAVRDIVTRYAINTGITTHVLDHVAVPRFDPSNDHRVVACAIDGLRPRF